MPLDKYLAILGAVTLTENPYSEEHPELAAGFAKLCEGVVAWISAARTHAPDGYAGGRDVLEELTHLFPAPEDEEAAPRLLSDPDFDVEAFLKAINEGGE